MTWTSSRGQGFGALDLVAEIDTEEAKPEPPCKRCKGNDAKKCKECQFFSITVFFLQLLDATVYRLSCSVLWSLQNYASLNVFFDEDDVAPRPIAMQAQNNSLRLIPTNQLRVNNGIAKLGTGSYTHQGVTLVPVSRPPGITTVVKILNHPAPLPLPPKFQNTNPLWKAMPPKPTLKISRLNAGKKYKYNAFDRHFSITVVFLLQLLDAFLDWAARSSGFSTKSWL
jgi:hypothetical protein